MPHARHNGYVEEEEMGWAHEAKEIDSPRLRKKRISNSGIDKNEEVKCLKAVDDKGCMEYYGSN